jgi:hypothetical protein
LAGASAGAATTGCWGTMGTVNAGADKNVGWAVTGAMTTGVEWIRNDIL